MSGCFTFYYFELKLAATIYNYQITLPINYYTQQPLNYFGTGEKVIEIARRFFFTLIPMNNYSIDIFQR